MTHERRLSFGGVAELYDEARPSYPAAMVNEIIEETRWGSPRRALEVGAGTGKATLLFAQRGVTVHAIEPSAEMAALARRSCGQLQGVTIERTEFERWEPGSATFPLVYAAQAWHWISAQAGYPKARSALPAGGLLAAFWNRPDWEACELREQIDAAYRATTPELAVDGPMHPAPASGSEPWNRWEREIDLAAGFGRAEVRGYRWIREYSSAEYVRLLQTHSDHIMLERRRREALLAEIGAVIEAHGGVLELTYVTHLCLARAC